MSLAERVFKPSFQQVRAYKGGKGRPNNQIAIHKLSSNENPFGSAPGAMEAMQAQLESVNDYPEQTDIILREALSGFYNNELAADQFITGNGGVAIIAMLVDAFLDASTSCIVSNPCFLPYIQFAEKVGARVIDIPLRTEAYLLDVDGILKAIDETTRIIWLCSPNNPTGTVIPKATIDELIAQVPDHVIVVYDEVYFQYVQVNDYIRGIEYVQNGNNVIGLNSFSKAYGLAGLRVGYAYTTPEIAAYINNAKRPFLLNRLSMAAAIGALEDDMFIKETVRKTLEGKDYLYSELDSLGIKYTPSAANFILIDPEMPSATFEEKMAALGIMVRPADAFGAPGKVRVTIGSTANNAAFITACKQVMRPK